MLAGLLGRASSFNRLGRAFSSHPTSPPTATGGIVSLDDLPESGLVVLYRDLDPLAISKQQKHGSHAYWVTADRLRKSVKAVTAPGDLDEHQPLVIQVGENRFAIGLSPRMTSKDAGLLRHQQQGAASSGGDHERDQQWELRLVAALQAEEAGGQLSFETASKTLFEPTLSSEEIQSLSKGRSMVFFHQTHRFCGACGSPTVLVDAGRSRTCLDLHGGCGKSWFPRVEPACIMLVANPDGTACIVGRQASWAKNRYSVLAGFVDAGERLEDAVAREVHEEVGVHVDKATCQYFGSQSFPFPHSLMLACTATAATTEIRVDNAELEHAFWLPKHELRDILANNSARMRDSQVHLPPPFAISHHLLRHFAEQAD